MPAPLRAVLCGLGGAAERLFLPGRRALPEIAIVAGCDPDPKARSRAERLGLVQTFDSAAEAVQRTNPDLALIAAPPAAHFELCRLALEAGAHVFCEKPFVESVEQADWLLALAAERRRLLTVNAQYRYMNIYRRTRQRIAAGDFGRLYAVQIWQQMFHPAEHERPPWRRAQRRATLYEFGAHALDLLTFLFDESPEAISALMPRPRSEFRSDAFVQATLRYPGGRLATLWLNRVSHAPMRYLEMRLECERASLRVSLGGVARVSLDWVSGPRARLSLVRGGEARQERGGDSRVYARERRPAFLTATVAHLREFAGRILAGETDLEPARRARDVLRACLAGYESAERAGDWVRLQSVE